MNIAAQRIVPAPIRHRLRIKTSHEKAFDTFTAGMGSWWMKSHTLQPTGQRDVIIEPRDGGRWYDVGEDGMEMEWGRVISWQRPDRLILAWQLNAEWTYDPSFETIVEVNFTPDGDHVIVEFEHRDLERFGDKALEVRGDYDSGMDGGWRELLAGYEALVGTAG
jgi:uncharacterized protein YndB with AHSA1/START domain